MGSNEKCLSENFGAAEIGVADFQTGISLYCLPGGILEQNLHLPRQNYPQDIQSCCAFCFV
ncbi:hypothetical protein BWD07_04460 [Neisseria canis]|nr:hypothetical protein BWD07_04460 [Neisseria canis]